MSSDPDSTINLQDASLFSALSYAPDVPNAVAWGLQQPIMSVGWEAALELGGTGWTDITTSALAQAKLPSEDFRDKSGDNEFRVFANSAGQVVFAFKGSNNTSNFVSDSHRHRF